MARACCRCIHSFPRHASTMPPSSAVARPQPRPASHPPTWMSLPVASAAATAASSSCTSQTGKGQVSTRPGGRRETPHTQQLMQLITSSRACHHCRSRFPLQHPPSQVLGRAASNLTGNRGRWGAGHAEHGIIITHQHVLGAQLVHPLPLPLAHVGGGPCRWVHDRLAHPRGRRDVKRASGRIDGRARREGCWCSPAGAGICRHRPPAPAPPPSRRRPEAVAAPASQGISLELPTPSRNSLLGRQRFACRHREPARGGKEVEGGCKRQAQRERKLS